MNAPQTPNLDKLPEHTFHVGELKNRMKARHWTYHTNGRSATLTDQENDEQKRIAEVLRTLQRFADSDTLTVPAIPPTASDPTWTPVVPGIERKLEIGPWAPDEEEIARRRMKGRAR